MTMALLVATGDDVPEHLECTPTDGFLVRSEEPLNDEIFERLGRSHFDPFVRHVRRVMRVSQDQAQDVVQIAFLKIWRSRHTYNPEKATIETWAWSVLQRTVIDRQRASSALKSKNEKLRDDEEIADQEEPQMETPEVLLFRKLNDAVVKEAIKKGLDELDEDQRQAVVALELEGKSAVELAAEMGISVNTLRSRCRLGLEKLRNKRGIQSVQGVL